MIAADSSSFIAHLKEEIADDVIRVREALINFRLALPSPVLTEILSNHRLPQPLIEDILQIPTLPIFSGFWYRAGVLRSKLLEKKLKARLADCLIAQSCIDHNVPLITRDEDFRHFVKYGLVLI